MHKIAVIALNDFVPFDLSIPCEVFGRARHPDSSECYEVSVCAETPEIRSGYFSITVPRDLSYLTEANTVIVPGINSPAEPVSLAVIQALQAASATGKRIVSICSGTFVLAAAGLLEGLRVTTHWMAAPLLAELYPALTIDPNVLFVDNGRILTSAGASAGIDLCLHLIRRDFGATIAAHVARLSVMPLERDGGQAQFIDHPPPSSGKNLQPLLDWLGQNLTEPVTLKVMAKRMTMSTRSLSRQFQAQTGMTPLQWILLARVRCAQTLLETSDLSVEKIAANVGFGSTTAFRERFSKVAGTNPQSYRRSFRQHR